MDAKENVKLANGERICWLSVGDEKSSAALCFEVFPYRLIGQVPPSEMQTFLQTLFHRWGLPDQIKVDNGLPLGNLHSDLPSALGFWFLSLGIEWVTNPPRRPQSNGLVEQLQSVSRRWASPHKQGSIESLQKRLNQAQQWQREGLPIPSLGNRTRQQAYPQLYQRRREFIPENKSLKLVKQYLCKQTYFRKVTRNGRVSLLGRRFYIGRKYAGQEVELAFDPEISRFIVRDYRRKFILRLDTLTIGLAQIQGLEIPKNNRRT